MSEILRTVNLSKSFLLSGVPRLILQDLNFHMDAGRFVSIIGSSGCGKSTFLELIAGITRPDTGDIYFRNEHINGKSGLLGYMPQSDLLFPWLNVVENVLLPVRVKSGSIKTARARIAELLPVFGLQDHARYLPYQLSGGLRQRTAFLRTYMLDTQLMLLDEPFASLDAITRIQLQGWLKDITMELKLSIILVTHDINEAITLSNEIHVMQSQPGRFVKVFKIEHSQANDDIARIALKNSIMELIKIDALPA